MPVSTNKTWLLTVCQLPAEQLRYVVRLFSTELSRTESRPEWRQLIAKVRTIYHGRILYAANFDAFERTPFWDALDAIGIDAYFPLSGDRHASDRALQGGAREVVARIDAVASKWKRPVILTELGYPSTPEDTASTLRRLVTAHR